MRIEVTTYVIEYECAQSSKITEIPPNVREIYTNVYFLLKKIFFYQNIFTFLS